MLDHDFNLFGYSPQHSILPRSVRWSLRMFLHSSSATNPLCAKYLGFVVWITFFKFSTDHLSHSQSERAHEFCQKYSKPDPTVKNSPKTSPKPNQYVKAESCPKEWKRTVLKVNGLANKDVHLVWPSTLTRTVQFRLDSP